MLYHQHAPEYRDLGLTLEIWRHKGTEAPASKSLQELLELILHDSVANALDSYQLRQVG